MPTWDKIEAVEKTVLEIPYETGVLRIPLLARDRDNNMRVPQDFGLSRIAQLWDKNLIKQNEKVFMIRDMKRGFARFYVENK